MVNCCANPECRKPLHYLREGKIFLFSVRRSQDRQDFGIPRLEHYWLCGPCSREWTLGMDGQQGVELIRLRRRRARAYSVAQIAPAC